jgi:hypothetical protein
VDIDRFVEKLHTSAVSAQRTALGLVLRHFSRKRSAALMSTAAPHARAWRSFRAELPDTVCVHHK